MINHDVDVALGLQYGDESKGKVVHSLCGEYEYDYVIRFNGGGNAGHTVYHNEEKFVTHTIPTGVFFGIKSIIGPGCVFNIKKLIEEADALEARGIEVYKNLFIARNAHIITDEHIQEENSEIKIGTTRQGIGPAYRDKYERKGIRAEERPVSYLNLIDMYDLLYNAKNEFRILCEGAQGFHLDIDWGDYPYVTSSHCGLGSVILNGIRKEWITTVFGVAKVYETYVGSKEFEDTDPIFAKIREVGNEFGATTGRPRKVGWLDIDRLVQSINMNSVNEIILSKLDVLKEVNTYRFFDRESGGLCDFGSDFEFTDAITDILCKRCNLDEQDILYSESKESIFMG